MILAALKDLICGRYQPYVPPPPPIPMVTLADYDSLKVILSFLGLKKIAHNTCDAVCIRDMDDVCYV